jgi:hypothetical protein
MGCIEAERGLFHVKEASAGHERLVLLMKAFRTPTPPPAFGDPVGGPSVYDVCVYDGTGALAAALRIDRAAQACGGGGRSCWRSMGAAGFRYRDPDLAAHGARRIVARGGAAGAGRLTLLAKNAVQHGRLSMPTGITAALAGHAQATVQVLVSDGACFGLTADDVRVAHPVVFRALSN